eukprot:2456151-Rhodomonas_salina.1
MSGSKCHMRSVLHAPCQAHSAACTMSGSTMSGSVLTMHHVRLTAAHAQHAVCGTASKGNPTNLVQVGHTCREISVDTSGISERSRKVGYLATRSLYT